MPREFGYQSGLVSRWLRLRCSAAAQCVLGLVGEFGSDQNLSNGREPGAIVLRRDIYVGESSSDARGCCKMR